MIERLTGTSEKMILAVINCQAQYDVYKRLEEVEDILEKYDINDLAALEMSLKRLCRLETLLRVYTSENWYKEQKRRIDNGLSHN